MLAGTLDSLVTWHASNCHRQCSAVCHSILGLGWAQRRVCRNRAEPCTLPAQRVPKQDMGQHAACRAGSHQQAEQGAPQAAAPGAIPTAPAPLRRLHAGPGRRHLRHSAGRPMRLAGKPAEQPPAQPITNCDVAHARGICKLGDHSLHRCLAAIHCL